MFGLQPTDLIIILVIALLIFGPSRLPEMGRAFGKTIREFQAATKDVTASLEDGIKSGAQGAEGKPKTK